MPADKKCSACEYCEISNNAKTGIDAKCKKLGVELKHVILWVAYTNGEGSDDTPEPMLDCPHFMPRKEKECQGCPSALTVYGDDLHTNILFYVCKRRHVIIGNTLDGKVCAII